MMGQFTKRTRPALERKNRRSRPRLEGLEDRKLLYATLGGTWVYGSRITYSFVPDGTSIGGVGSNLYATLDAKYPTATWKAAFQKAAAVWSSYANINLAQVSDNGAPLDTTGNQQNDSRFGDIRISMIPQNSGALAFAMLPPPFNGGPDAGDIVFNSNIDWKVNSNYDLQTVAIHEMGHALGLDHSTISSAVMYAYYGGLKQSLAGDDISGIQSVWGAYPADPVNDGSFATATNITGLIGENGQVALGGRSLAGTADRDYYYVTAPSDTTGTMVVTMQASGLSSASPRLQLYNGNQSVIGGVSAPESYGGTVTYTVTGVTPGKSYYILALAASAMGSYGSYGLLVNFGTSYQPPIQPPDTTVGQQADRGGGTINMAQRGPWGLGRAPLLNPELIQVGNHSAFGDVLTVNEWVQSLGVLDPRGMNLPSYPGGPTNSQVGYPSEPTPIEVVPTVVDVSPGPITIGTVDLADGALDQLSPSNGSTIKSILKSVRERNVIVRLS